MIGEILACALKQDKCREMTRRGSVTATAKNKFAFDGLY